MASINLTAGGNVTVAGASSKTRIQVNAALTGTIIVKDGTVTIATITNPTVGSQFEYWDFVTNVQVNPSTTCDITVCTYGGYGAK